jgi:hypothetical protein
MKELRQCKKCGIMFIGLMCPDCGRFLGIETTKINYEEDLKNKK